mmetsp:Transcript_3729/g.13352  ORF Transcript_3729/g.13352 Transcript_3729/m.13352 type:complete len:331 (-) Transcript_3729:984-1976(-)
MQVQATAEAPSSSSGLSYKLHPLAIVNISDHYTRRVMAARQRQAKGAAPAEGGGEVERVIGLLLGEQHGRVVEVWNSFELDIRRIGPDGSIELDRDFLLQRKEQYQKTFARLDVIGWYSTGQGPPGQKDLELHNTLTEFNEAPVYLVLDPLDSRELPVSLYETETRFVDGEATQTFSKATYTIETAEAERIAVDHAARIVSGSGGAGSSAADSRSELTSQHTAHLAGAHGAVRMLASRVRVLHEYVELVRAGQLPYDHALLRDISSLTRRLPAMNSDQFQQDFLTDYNDTLLVTYLASITKGTSAVNELVEKFNVALDPLKSRRRGYLSV